ncbi:MAG: hypothetical protein ACTSYA_09385 [Candidatus Kariarchaeaceae archaeon]
MKSSLLKFPCLLGFLFMWVAPIYSALNSSEETFVGSEVFKNTILIIFVILFLLLILVFFVDSERFYFLILLLTFIITMPFAFGEFQSLLEIGTFLFTLELGLFSIRKANAEKKLIRSTKKKVTHHLEALQSYYLKSLSRYVSLFFLSSVSLYIIVIYLSELLTAMNRLIFFFMIIILLSTILLIIRFMKEEKNHE